MSGRAREEAREKPEKTIAENAGIDRVRAKACAAGAWPEVWMENCAGAWPRPAARRFTGNTGY